MELITPVEYGKMINIPPQQVYGMMKKGLPTHKIDHKGKMRDMIDPTEANEWRKLYETTKRSRRTKEEIEDGTPINEEAREYQPMLKGGELILTQRGSRNISVSRAKGPDNEHFAYLQRNMYKFPFLLNSTREHDWFISSQNLKRRILHKEVIIDTPLQVMEYCLAQIEVCENKEMADEIRAIIQKHTKATQENLELAEKVDYNYNR